LSATALSVRANSWPPHASQRGQSAANGKRQWFVGLGELRRLAALQLMLYKDFQQAIEGP
jgi:hypothetical protein